MLYNDINLIECPRDAIQGINHFIDTRKKAQYINKLIYSNLFEYIDFGAFVSEKYVPQMKDTIQLVEQINKVNNTKLLSIVANVKGAKIAVDFDKIDYLGYPFSISETFQQRNTNSSIDESFQRVQDIYEISNKHNKQLIVYISMAFGNPYGDIWNTDIVLNWIYKLSKIGIKRFSLADTTSEANEYQIKELFSLINRQFPYINFNLHLHSRVESAELKINAAYESGCRCFEGAFLGYGGCPFAKDELIGNIPMELLLEKFNKSNLSKHLFLMTDFQDLIS